MDRGSRDGRFASTSAGTRDVIREWHNESREIHSALVYPPPSCTAEGRINSENKTIGHRVNVATLERRSRTKLLASPDERTFDDAEVKLRRERRGDGQ